VHVAMRVPVIAHSIRVALQPSIHHMLEGAWVVGRLVFQIVVRKGDRRAQLDERDGLLAFGVRNEVGGSPLVVASPTAPILDSIEHRIVFSRIPRGTPVRRSPNGGRLVLLIAGGRNDPECSDPERHSECHTIAPVCWFHVLLHSRSYTSVMRSVARGV